MKTRTPFSSGTKTVLCLSPPAFNTPKDCFTKTGSGKTYFTKTGSGKTQRKLNQKGPFLSSGASAAGTWRCSTPTPGRTRAAATSPSRLALVRNTIQSFLKGAFFDSENDHLLPRQAQDKHRKSLDKTCSVQGGSPSPSMGTGGPTLRPRRTTERSRLRTAVRLLCNEPTDWPVY